MFCSIFFGRCKSTMLLGISYCVSICCLALDILPQFIQGVILANQGNIKYHWFLVFNFHVLQLFFFHNSISFNLWYLLFKKNWSAFYLSFLPWCIALYLLTMKSLVYSEIYTFHQQKIYWKPVTFLPICFP